MIRAIYSNLISTTDRNGRTIELDYDDVNRQTEQRWLVGMTLVNTLTLE